MTLVPQASARRGGCSIASLPEQDAEGRQVGALPPIWGRSTAQLLMVLCRSLGVAIDSGLCSLGWPAAGCLPIEQRQQSISVRDLRACSVHQTRVSWYGIHRTCAACVRDHRAHMMCENTSNVQA